MANLHRIFIAVNLPENVRQKLALVEDRCLDLLARWTKPENLHITLVFLGNANDQEICDICQAVEAVAKKHEPFDVTLSKICYGPQNNPPAGRPPRMVWAVGERSTELGKLQKDLESSLFEFCGGNYDSNREYEFQPHVTLARIKQTELRHMEPEELPRIDEQIHHTFLVESIELMESELKRGGPTYTVLESIKLGE